MTRITRDAWAMELAQVTARRSTCLRRAVGCVLLDGRGHVLATGYNGVAAGQPHCNEVTGEGYDGDLDVLLHAHACPGAWAPSGTQLDNCRAIHAEQNALLQCRDVHLIQTCYVTTSPCMTCTKLLLNTSCREIVFRSPYPGLDATRDLWVGAGRVWTHQHGS